jgi:hypothetical protein
MEPTHQANGGSATAKQVHDDVEESLRPRDREPGSAGRLQDRLKTASGAVWQAAKRHPFLASAALGVAGAVGAVTIGATELAFAGALAFAAYKVLREGEPPLQALAEVERDVF